MSILNRTIQDVEEILEEEDMKLPSGKRAALVVIDLRTKLEMRTLFLRVSMSLNMALVGGIVVRLLINN